MTGGRGDPAVAPPLIARAAAGAWPRVALVLILLANAAIRLRVLGIPLDRDEGEYAYMGQLILQGVPPYVEAYNMKMPGTYAVYAAILAIFGRTPAAIHAGLVVANSVAIGLVYLLGRRLVSPGVGVAAAVSFAALAMSPAMFGLAAYAEHFVVVAALAGVLVLLRGLETGSRLLLGVAGVLFGLGFLIKQAGGIFGVFAVAWVLVAHLRGPARGWRAGLTDVAAVAAGALLPFAVVCLVLGVTGSFSNFWFWTFRYASQYVSAVPFRIGLRQLSTNGNSIVESTPLLVAAAAVGLMILFRDAAFRDRRLFIGLFALFSFLAVTPGLYFRRQYFILLLPALAILAGLVPHAVSRRFVGRPLAMVAAACALALVPALQALWAERVVLFQASPNAAAREMYGRNPFPESLVIADYLRRNSAGQDTIAVVGSEPQIYFYTGRRAATGFIYMYPLMERHPYAVQMQEEMIRQIEAADPKFVVFVNVSTSWLRTPDSDRTLFRWFEQYRQRFDVVGVVDIVSPTLTRYVWDNAAATYTAESRNVVAVLRRRADGR